MPTPPLHSVLEPEHVSALLANFAQMFPRPLQLCLVDAEAQIVGCHPPGATQFDVDQLLAALERVRQFGRWTWVPLGVAAPVRARGELVGILVVATDQDFEPKEKAALQLLARVLSLLIDNRLTQNALLQESLDRYQELNLLYRAGETIASSLDLAQVNRLILDESVRLLHADEGAVMLIDPANGQLTVWASHGLDALQDIGAGIPAGHELAQQVVRTGARATHMTEPSPDPQRKKPVSAVLCVPIKTKDKVVGVISLAHTAPGKTFQANDANLLNALAGQAAVALDNARMFNDLSALHTQLEAANRRLRELDRLKSSFIGAITHELRSPFANIAFSLQLIERYGTLEWPPHQREQWEQLNHWVREAKRMVDNLVNLAALLSKQGDLVMEELDFSALVKSVADTLALVGDPRRIRVTIEAPPEMPFILADAKRLEEALYHLIHNAIKFNRPGGSVTVRYGPKKGGILFEVQDTGVGIPADKLSTLWDPFTQMADPLKRGVEGLGLGLALVRYVVHAHGGKVGVSSQEGVGSTFRFWLPADPKGSGDF
jgi:signal transduction histidine kinase